MNILILTSYYVDFQVREFFASQRTRVRKLVRLSREKALRSNACSGFQDGVPTSSDSLVPIDPVPLNTINPTNVEETPSCSTEDDVLPGINDLDKQFVESIFSLMQKEETFSGQVKLMEWILQIQNSAVLCWYLLINTSKHKDFTMLFVSSYHLFMHAGF